MKPDVLTILVGTIYPLVTETLGLDDCLSFIVRICLADTALPLNFDICNSQRTPTAPLVDYLGSVESLIDKQKVGQIAAEIRAFRPPEPYKGKGIRYQGEHVKIKPGKAAT